MAKPKSKRASPSSTKRVEKSKNQKVPLIPFLGELPLEERRASGKALREKLTHEGQGEWSRRSDFPGAVEIVMQGNQGRQPKLIPLRMARMACSLFAFYRGAATAMTHDLAPTPTTGLMSIVDGDVE